MKTKPASSFLSLVTFLLLSWPGAPGAQQEPHLVRFDGPVGPGQRRALVRAGAEILEAVPPHGYLVRMAGEESGRSGLERLGARVEPVSPEAKLSPELRAVFKDGTLPGGPITLRAVTFLGRPVAGPADAVRELVPPKATFLPVQDASGRGYLWLRVGPDELVRALERLVSHPDVLMVERLWPLEFKNDNSSWLIQSAKQEQGRTVWRRGLTGWGQVAGVADSGLDADACQFRYGPERDAVTLAIDDPQPPGAVVDRPENKVITYYVVGSADAYDDATAGFHGTHTVGDVAGDDYAHLATATAAGHDEQDGMAPGAQIVFQDIGAENGELSLMGVSMYDLLLQAYDTGARVHNNSYGVECTEERILLDPDWCVTYDADSSSIDQASWELNDLLVVFAAGNSGMSSEGDPWQKSLGRTGSTAKNTLVVGASGPVEFDFIGSTFYLEEDLLIFSSQGPTEDNRLRPDLVAPGMVSSATSDLSTAINLGCCVFGSQNDKVVSNNEDDNCNVDTPAFGTSFSSPIAVGAAALVRQYFTDGFWLAGKADLDAGFNPTNALLKAAMIAGAKPLTGVIIGIGTQDELTMPPSFEQGWGRVHLEDALHFEGDERHTLVLDDVPNPVPHNPMLAGADLAPFQHGSEPLSTGQERSWHLPVPREDRVLKACLVWSDPAALPYSEITLVNNLDLEVTAPNGDQYMGNKDYDRFGFSQPSVQGQRDTNNNVECVILKSPEQGWHRVLVLAESVDGNGQEGSDAQGYAVVVTGEFEAPAPEALEPDHAAPGEVLENVQLTGQHFVPGMEIDLGAGIEIQGFEVTDRRTAMIATLSVAEDAELGERDATVTVLHTLTRVGQGLFEVSEQEQEKGGCSCGNTAGPGVGLLLLLAVWLSLVWRNSMNRRSVTLRTIMICAVSTLPMAASAEQPPATATEPGVPTVEELLKKAEASSKTIKDYSGLMDKQEHFLDEMGELEKTRIKFSRPFMVYIKFLNVHNGREAIFVRGRNDNEVKVHKGSFPDITLNLDTLGDTAMEGNHHPITDFGLENTIRISARNLRKAIERKEGEFKVSDHGVVNGRPVWKIEARLPKGGHFTTAREDETLWDIARRTGQDMYLIMFTNKDEYDEPDDPDEGDRVFIPRYYGGRSEILLDKENYMPVKATTWDWRGRLYETYSYREMKYNQGLTRKDFDPDNEEYDF